MATFKELIDKTDLFVTDKSLFPSLGDFINQGVSEISGGVPSLLDGISDPIPNSLIPPLPELFTIGSVATSVDDPYVSMPSNFQRGLHLVASSSGRELDIAHSFIEFIETYPLLDKSGNITEVIEHGNKLYYQGIPTTTEELTLYYYRKPVEMVDDTDIPDGIPEHLQISLLVNFASWKAYKHIEEGMDGETPNTFKFKNAFLEAVRTLEISLPSYTRGLMLR